MTKLDVLEEERPTSAVYQHCVTVYKEMESQARQELLGDPPDQQSALVYEGHLTKLFASLQMATPYYTSIMKHLRRMGCVEQIRRGGGNSPSRWQLAHAPTEDLFKNVESLAGRRSGKTEFALQQIRDQQRLINQLTDRVALLEAREEMRARPPASYHNPPSAMHMDMTDETSQFVK